MPRFFFVTGAVRDLFTKRGYTGVTFVPLNALRKCIVGTLTPGALSNWFSDARTKEIIAYGNYLA